MEVADSPTAEYSVPLTLEGATLRIQDSRVKEDGKSVEYEVAVQAEDGAEWAVWTTWAELKRVDEALRKRYRKSGPKVPEFAGRAWFKSETDEEFREERRLDLQLWCMEVLRRFPADEVVVQFLYRAPADREPPLRPSEPPNSSSLHRSLSYPQMVYSPPASPATPTMRASQPALGYQQQQQQQQQPQQQFAPAGARYAGTPGMPLVPAASSAAFFMPAAAGHVHIPQRAKLGDEIYWLHPMLNGAAGALAELSQLKPGFDACRSVAQSLQLLDHCRPRIDAQVTLLQSVDGPLNTITAFESAPLPLREYLCVVCSVISAALHWAKTLEESILQGVEKEAESPVDPQLSGVDAATYETPGMPLPDTEQDGSIVDTGAHANTASLSNYNDNADNDNDGAAAVAPRQQEVAVVGALQHHNNNDNAVMNEDAAAAAAAQGGEALPKTLQDLIRETDELVEQTIAVATEEDVKRVGRRKQALLAELKSRRVEERDASLRERWKELEDYIASKVVVTRNVGDLVTMYEEHLFAILHKEAELERSDREGATALRREISALTRALRELKGNINKEDSPFKLTETFRSHYANRVSDLQENLVNFEFEFHSKYETSRDMEEEVVEKLRQSHLDQVQRHHQQVEDELFGL